MSKLNNIYHGWKNYLFESDEVEDVAKERASICADCDNAVKGVFEIIKDQRIKEITGLICDVCKCPLSTKLRSKEEECPIKKW